MTKEIATMMIPLHIRAPASGEGVLLRLVGADAAGVETVDVTITAAGLYITTLDGPALAVSLKGLCNAALKAAGALGQAGAA